MSDLIFTLKKYFTLPIYLYNKYKLVVIYIFIAFLLILIAYYLVEIFFIELQIKKILSNTLIKHKETVVLIEEIKVFSKEMVPKNENTFFFENKSTEVFVFAAIFSTIVVVTIFLKS